MLTMPTLIAIYTLISPIHDSLQIKHLHECLHNTNVMVERLGTFSYHENDQVQ